MSDTPTPSRIYELLFEASTEGLIMVGRSGRIELANQRMCDIFGYSTSELKSMNVDDLLPEAVRGRHKKHRDGYTQSPHSRPMGRGYDLVGQHKKGHEVPVEISLNHFEEGGELKIMALIMDVTLRREQEEEIRTLNRDLEERVRQRTRELHDSQQLYRSIARNFPNGTINVFDRQFKYIFAEGRELYEQGIAIERLVGKSYLDQLPPELRPDMEEKLKQVLDGNNLNFETQHQGEHYMINAAALADEEGKVNRILLVEQNITQRREAEEKIKESLAKEKRLNELKSRFVSMASHEFRTPLSTILSSLSLLEKYDQAGTEDKKPKHYKRIRSSVRHLTSILNDFLSLEKVETGKVSVHRSEFDLQYLLQELVEQHRDIAKAGQEIHFEFEGPESCVCDQNMIRIITTNLLSNAVKYSNEHGHIWFTVKSTGKKLDMRMKDQGIGIPLDDQESMFERFFRAKNALNFEGTGLGLNIVHRYLQLLGGDISFESQPEVGSTFYISIPTEDQQ